MKSSQNVPKYFFVILSYYYNIPILLSETILLIITSHFSLNIIFQSVYFCHLYCMYVLYGMYVNHKLRRWDETSHSWKFRNLISDNDTLTHSLECICVSHWDNILVYLSVIREWTNVGEFVIHNLNTLTNQRGPKAWMGNMFTNCTFIRSTTLLIYLKEIDSRTAEKLTKLD